MADFENWLRNKGKMIERDVNEPTRQFIKEKFDMFSPEQKAIARLAAEKADRELGPLPRYPVTNPVVSEVPASQVSPPSQGPSGIDAAIEMMKRQRQMGEELAAQERPEPQIDPSQYQQSDRFSNLRKAMQQDPNELSDEDLLAISNLKRP